ncbi:protease inhibitor I9 family protein [Salinicoccus sesuvii]|uniref:Protease inhibitor I9 family protein n=1 Tax=Salinicoccus sesuvii TaxID=868281 RepID=A0ABV7N656_9STAP
MKKYTLSAICILFLIIAGCKDMEDRNDYLVGVNGELTEADLAAVELDQSDIKHRYKMMKVYVITMTEKEAMEVETLDKVSYVELDQAVRVPDQPEGK